MATAASPAARTRTAFFVISALLLGATLVFGFSRSFFLQPLFDTPDLALPYMVHGFCGTAWFVLLVRQAMLAKAGNIAGHRRVGALAPWFALAVIASTLWVIIFSLSLPMTGSGLKRHTGLLIQASTLSWFTGLFLLGWSQRHRPEAHKRYMLLATITMMSPAFSRISRLFRDGGPPPFDSAFLASFFIGALAIYDYRSRRRIHPITLTVGLLYLLWAAVRQPIGKSEAWANLVAPLVAG